MVKKIVDSWKVDDSKPVIVEKYDKVAVKNGIDDLLRKTLTTKYNVTETYKTRDTRLLICFVACLFSGFGCLYDFLHPFPESKMVLAICSLSYFTITGLLYVWEWFVEKGTFFEGTLNGNVVKLSSYIPRYSGDYTISGESNVDNAKSEVKYTKCISTWLDDSGKILPENIEKETDHLYQNLFKSKAQ
ncbi:hypothetical protein ACHWQZ_G008498 [Mnemiopsis leidyi]